MSTECLITGCDFIDTAHGAVAHGDLHCVDGDTFVFNAVLDDDARNTRWNYTVGEANPLHLSAKDFFERRGVLVFSVRKATLSPLAANYIGVQLDKRNAP